MELDSLTAHRNVAEFKFPEDTHEDSEWHGNGYVITQRLQLAFQRMNAGSYTFLSAIASKLRPLFTAVKALCLLLSV